MPLIEIRADLGRVADALERIQYLLERLVYPPPPAALKPQPATLEDLYMATPEANERANEEQREFAERHLVVPGSDAMQRALADWEREQKRIYGEDWEAPEVWRQIAHSLEDREGGRTETHAETRA